MPAFFDRHHRVVVVLALALALAGAALAATLPLHTGFAWLLPDDQPSVVALHALEARQPAEGVIQVGVAADDPEAVRRFTADLAARLRREVPPDLLSDVEEGDGELRRFAWAHRHLYAARADLEAALAALRDRVARAEQKANPFLVDLDDDVEVRGAPAEPAGPGDLRRKLDDARARALADPGYVAEDGHLRMLVLRGPFGDAEPEKAERLLAAVDRAVRALEPARYAPSLAVGYTGDPVAAATEHGLILRDVAVTAALCLVLVALVLLVGLRSPRAVIALCLALAVGCAVTFGLARLLIGHLNTSTAFLGSVVAGNGINFGIILVARYLEERRRGARHAPALACAASATSVPTGVACLAAGCAYFSLTITSFRGFSELGIIAGTGMIACWIASYALLPALLTWFDRRRDLAPAPTRSAPTPRRPRLGRAAAAIVTTAAALLGLYGVLRLARDPFEDDLRTLRSRSFAHTEAGRWTRRMDAAFGRDRSGGFYIGAVRVEDVPAIVEAVRAAERDLPPEARLFGRIDAISEALPGDEPAQRSKLALLAELRRLADRVAATLDDDAPDAHLLRDLRPPDDLAPLAFADLPARLQQRLTERDGRVGLLLVVHPGPAFDNWSYRSIRRAVERLRRLPLDPAIARTLQISGLESIFADMMTAVETEGPRASLLALALVLVLLVVALRPGAALAVTAFALFAGLFGMLGLMALLGVRLNFINYIAIPITVGIGVDYPFNVAARLRRDRAAASPPSREGLRATAAAVALCSATTIIGYGVLLISDNGAIRSFGAAAVLGELTCVTAALVIVPALLAARARRPAPPATPTWAASG